MDQGTTCGMTGRSSHTPFHTEPRAASKTAGPLNPESDVHIEPLTEKPSRHGTEKAPGPLVPECMVVRAGDASSILHKVPSAARQHHVKLHLMADLLRMARTAAAPAPRSRNVDGSGTGVKPGVPAPPAGAPHGSGGSPVFLYWSTQDVRYGPATGVYFEVKTKTSVPGS